MTELVPPSGFAAARPLAVRWAARSARGGRENNEDSYLVARLQRSFETLSTNVPASELPRRLDRDGWLLAVADGLGGLASGEVASALAISAGARFVLDQSRWNLRLEEQDLRDLVERARAVFQAIDESVAARAAERSELAGMATTLTAAYVIERALVLLHVGDSRAYLWRGGELQQLTRDQTLAQRLADEGAISQDAVAGHRLRHVLQQALGRPERELEVEVVREQVQPGDRLLLATDGLVETVSDEEIAAMLRATPSDERACLEITDRALARHAADNVTVVLASFAEPRS
jgi:serine/threonine protein phosphatase PrpC